MNRGSLSITRIYTYDFIFSIYFNRRYYIKLPISNRCNSNNNILSRLKIITRIQSYISTTSFNEVINLFIWNIGFSNRSKLHQYSDTAYLTYTSLIGALAGTRRGSMGRVTWNIELTHYIYSFLKQV